MARRLKSRVQAALEGQDPQLGRAVAVLVYGAILASALVITLQSLRDLPGWAVALLRGAELTLLAIFVAEYAARLWSAPSRWRYALSFWGIVDLLAILPALLLLAPHSQTLRVLRLMRIFRLLKLFRMRRALMRLEHALDKAREDLLLFLLLAAIVLFLAAVGIHHFEKDAQPDSFGTIPNALWWALATLTTVGYGDVYPVTVAGKIFTALTLMVGLGIVAIPAGIIASALLNAPARPDETEASGDDPDTRQPKTNNTERE
ncbi:ion transporter [Pseudoponticoccus marisrubri]|uniref:Voltage-gated potassium channel n=1 Tax=Pseudoponticoccus marisrubri TaxID=1685382 RepID=A0A0W7WGS4_9RHOB|nr:ion transporter [Pseudoponticoccus marisrubri]KUF09802.1 voltage-gated potassium channel [Pseudoponticoccus marisrubri]